MAEVTTTKHTLPGVRLPDFLPPVVVQQPGRPGRPLQAEGHPRLLSRQHGHVVVPGGHRAGLRQHLVRVALNLCARPGPGVEPEEVQAVAGDVWVELAASDAAALGVGEGDLVRVESERGHVQGPVRIADIRPGTAFVPFHYGHWEDGTPGPEARPPRAANELTRTFWDPVSKQPLYKVVAAAINPVGEG